MLKPVKVKQIVVGVIAIPKTHIIHTHNGRPALSLPGWPQRLPALLEPSKVYIVTYKYNNDHIIIKELNKSSFSTIVDIDYLYENFKLYHSEVEYLLYDSKNSA